jgi:transcriptional regulator with XRE-family HTH domain
MVEPDTLGGRLAAAMKARGMTITALADKSGLTYQGVRKIALGQTKNINAATCAALAEHLRISAEWLGTGAGAMEDKRPALAPPPLPNKRFDDRHEVSESDWGILQDVQLVMSEAQLRDLREQAERIRRIAARQVAELAEIGQAPQSPMRRLTDRLPGNLGAPIQTDYNQPDRRKQGGQ